jgi:acyl dehydratase
VSPTRILHLTDEMLRAYSRRGNFHSEPAEAERLGLPGLVAQGMQAAGPAYGLLLDAWGDDFLAHGQLECAFVAMVTGGQTVEATVSLEGDEAEIEVVNRDAGRTAVVGSARRRSAP